MGASQASIAGANQARIVHIPAFRLGRRLLPPGRLSNIAITSGVSSRANWPVASNPPTTSLKRLLLVPVIVLAIPVAASYAGYKWMQTRGVSFHLIFLQTKDGWRQMPMPAGSLADNLRVSSRGTVWLDTWAGVSRWDGSAWRLYEETGSHDKAGPTY